MAGLLGAALRGLGRAVKKSPGTSGKLRSKNMQDFLKETKLKARESMYIWSSITRVW